MSRRFRILNPRFNHTTRELRFQIETPEGAGPVQLAAASVFIRGAIGGVTPATRPLYRIGEGIPSLF